MFKHLIVGSMIIFLLIFQPLSGISVQQKGLSKEQIRFVEEALSRLKHESRRPAIAVTDEVIKSRKDEDEIRSLFSDLSAAEEVSLKEWIQLTLLITSAAKEKDIKSELTITTHVEGATIKYELAGDRGTLKQPIVIKEPTTCEETVLIGLYYIWAERSGRVTSDKNALYRIVNKDEKVRIDENRFENSSRSAVRD
jgi:hypothetical protein